MEWVTVDDVQWHYLMNKYTVHADPLTLIKSTIMKSTHAQLNEQKVIKLNFYIPKY